MHTFFFFGSLRHLPLLEIVLGRPVETRDIAQDCLLNSEVRWAGDDPFPLIVQGQGTGTAGIRIDGISDDEAARLDFFEGDDEYDIAELNLESGHVAKCYVPGRKLGAPGQIWLFEDWRETYADFLCLAAADYMSLYGTMPEAEADARWPAIQKRAWSGALALRNQTASSGDVQVADRRRAYSKFFALDEIDLIHSRFDGGRTDLMSRAVFVGMDAAILLPYDPVRDRVLLIEQFRAGPLGRGDPNPWVIEPIAGHVDPGEDPKDAARREAREEAGVELRDVIPMATCYPSPGASTEFYHIFVGLTDLPDDVIGVHGVAAEDEDIRSLIMEFDDFLQWMDDGHCRTAPLLSAGYWLARHRGRFAVS